MTKSCVCVLEFRGEGFTFAVGICTAIDGVGSRPGAEGCMAEGCMGLKVPWENIETQHNRFVITYVGNDFYYCHVLCNILKLVHIYGSFIIYFKCSYCVSKA